jgi:hypothetical protein
MSDLNALKVLNAEVDTIIKAKDFANVKLKQNLRKAKVHQFNNLDYYFRQLKNRQLNQRVSHRSPYIVFNLVKFAEFNLICTLANRHTK